MMDWFKNKDNRIRFIKNADDNRPTEDYLRDVYTNYFAIKKAHKDHDVVTCTRCGLDSNTDKKQKEYVCDCGFHHTSFKNTRFKNFNEQFIIRSRSIHEGQEIFNFYLVYVGYDYVKRLVVFGKPLLIAKEMHVEEKAKDYHYNIGHMRIMGYYDIYSYVPNKNTSESVIINDYYKSHMSYGYDYYRADEFDLKYVNVDDQYIKGYPIEAIKINAYLIEILQKYKSSYLFSQLYVDQRVGQSNKLLDLFQMRNSGLSNKQLVSIIKYFSKYKNLDISIYKDYLNDLRTLGYKLNDYNLKNKNYKERHNELSKRITQAKNKKKNKAFIDAYNNINDVQVDDVFIIVPKSMDDLVDEGKTLNHCVGNGTYANKVIEGKSKIFFVRKNPDEPLLTAEVSGEDVRQLRGYGNLLNKVSEQFFNKSKTILKNYLQGQYNDQMRKEQRHATS